MHGYIGNANNDPATLQVFDDSDNWTATIVATPFQSLADSVAYFRSRVNQCSANWPHPVTAWSGSQVGGGSLALETPPIWDSGYARWVAPFVDGSSQCHILQSFDGYQWSEFGVDPTATGSSFACTGIISRPTDGALVIIGVFSGTVTGPADYLWTSSGITAGAAPGGSPGSGHWYSGGWAAASSNVWVVWQGGSTATAPWYSATGLTWTTATTWAPPAGFTIHDRAHILVNSGAVFFAILFPAGTSVVSQMMATLDGKIWATEPMPTFTLGGEQVIDATYDAFTNTIYLLSGNGSTSHLWSSSVFGTWTLVYTLNRQTFALRANGRELLIWTSFAGAGASGGTLYGALVSTNGGTVWQGPLMPRSSSAPGNYFAIRSSGSQFMYCNTNEYATSSFVGALPATVV